MYRSLNHAVADLEKAGQLLRVPFEVDPNLEMAEIHRRIFEDKGPAILFESVKGSPFAALSNLYGTFDRTDYIFRKELSKIKRLVALKANPSQLLKRPFDYSATPLAAMSGLPKRVRNAPVLKHQTTISALPQVVSWPMDGGAFITLPQVCSLPPGSQQVMQSNIGMYRIQLSGNDYQINDEVGLHYQLHRGIGVHHAAYQLSDEPFKVSIAVGGPPSHAFSAIMPLPEGMSELTFAGMLNGRRFRYQWHDGYLINADADFVICGIVDKKMEKPEGPFGDHLGYYSLVHNFPVMKVAHVFHKKDPIWHMTVVGRPPAEDSSFGYLISELVGGLLSSEFPGITDVNAADAAGVHPLLLAVGSERYMPFRAVNQPEEILIQANHLLGKGQTSLAKFLWIADGGAAPQLSAHDYTTFFRFMLERVNWRRDIHFQTNTTIDTLDYSGDGWNSGSKVIIAAAGEAIRTLGIRLPDQLHLPQGYTNPTIVMPGILAISGPSGKHDEYAADKEKLAAHLLPSLVDSFPLVVLCDDAPWLAAEIDNFLWATFTRANPAADISGTQSSHVQKHWGCDGSLIIDARMKPHHAPLLVPDAAVSARVDQLMEQLKWS